MAGVRTRLSRRKKARKDWHAANGAVQGDSVPVAQAVVVGVFPAAPQPQPQPLPLPLPQRQAPP